MNVGGDLCHNCTVIVGTNIEKTKVKKRRGVYKCIVSFKKVIDKRLCASCVCDVLSSTPPIDDWQTNHTPPSIHSIDDRYECRCQSVSVACRQMSAQDNSRHWKGNFLVVPVMGRRGGGTAQYNSAWYPADRTEMKDIIIILDSRDRDKGLFFLLFFFPSSSHSFGSPFTSYHTLSLCAAVRLL